MPELPEVETVVRTLEHQLGHVAITKVKVLYPRIIEGNPKTFCAKLKGQHFRKYMRRGKYLIFEMDDFLFVAHMRMEGKFYVQKPTEPITKHMHVIFSLSNGKELRYNDTRKFGRMELLPKDTDLASFHDLGPEPFSDDLTSDYVLDYLKNKHKPIKEILLDQHFIAGIGNIYADEICFAMGIDPRKAANKVTKKQAELLVKSCRSIMKKAIKAGGTTIRSYTSSLGVTGRFQLQVKVHGRKDEPCKVCKTPIIKTTVGGRGTYYCPKCQK